jgi:hypothetical protein
MKTHWGVEAQLHALPTSALDGGESLPLIDMIYCYPETKATPSSATILDWYGFRFSTTLWNVFVIELRYSIVFSVVQTVMEFERIGWL